jgi:hypothetical protein
MQMNVYLVSLLYQRSRNYERSLITRILREEDYRDRSRQGFSPGENAVLTSFRESG